MGPGWDLIELLADEAGFAASQLHESWTRPAGKKSLLAEQKALWYGVHLVYDCKQALFDHETEGRALRQRVMSYPDPETRYEVEAALMAVARREATMEPYRRALARLSIPSEPSLEAMCHSLREQEPSALQAWHNWLWPKGASASDHGDSSVFAIAAARLSHGMEAILAADADTSDAHDVL